MGNPIGISIIGTGFIGRVHAGCVSANPSARIASLYDVNGAVAEKTATEFSAEAAGSIEEAVEAADAVIIGTPTSTHGEIARLCIERRSRFCARSRWIPAWNRHWPPPALQRKRACLPAWG